MQLVPLYVSEDNTIMLVEDPVTGRIQVQTATAEPRDRSRQNKRWLKELETSGVEKSTLETLSPEQIYELVVALDGTRLEEIPRMEWTPRLVRRAFEQNYRVVELLSPNELQVVLTPKDIEGLLRRSGEYLFSLDHPALRDPPAEWIQLALTSYPECIRYFDPDDIDFTLATTAVTRDPMTLNAVPFTVLSQVAFWDTVVDAATVRPDVGAFVRPEWPAALVTLVIAASPRAYLFLPASVRDIQTPLGRSLFESVRSKIPLSQIAHVLSCDQVKN